LAGVADICNSNIQVAGPACLLHSESLSHKRKKGKKEGQGRVRGREGPRQRRKKMLAYYHLLNIMLVTYLVIA
jgi:hypothetical protein